VCISTGALAYNGHALARWAYVRETVSSDAELSAVLAVVHNWQLLAQLGDLGVVIAITIPSRLSDV
jgi:hypothetical protein